MWSINVPTWLELHPLGRKWNVIQAFKSTSWCEKLVFFPWKPNSSGFLTFQRPSDGKKLPGGTFYFPDHAENLNRCQTERWTWTTRAPVLCSAFLYSPALTQPDLRARLQHTPTLKTTYALSTCITLSGSLSQTHPLPPPCKTIRTL